MTQIENVIQAITFEQRMASWGKQFQMKRGELNTMSRAAYEFYLEWLASGQAGDFAGTLATHSGLSRTTAWRAYRAGMALKHGAKEDADLMDLIQAAKAFENGADMDEINQAIEADKVKDLADKLSIGTVGRSMDVEVAELREQVLNRFGNLGMEGVRPKEREAIVYRSFLVASDDQVKALIEAHRAMTESSPDMSST